MGSAHLQSQADDAALKNDALLKKVDDHYNHLASLRAHFREDYSGMGMHRSETGTLLLKKPGRMRFTYDAPAGKIFTFDGKFAWFYTPGDPQAQKITAKQIDDLHTPLIFLLGHTQLKKELQNITITPTGSELRIAGIPKGMQQRIHQLTLQVTPEGLITAMQVEEIDGATTSFTFTAMQENPPTTNADFAFTPPAGVTVVTGTPPI